MIVHIITKLVRDNQIGFLDEGEPECEIGLDGRGEADMTAFGGLVLSGSDATQEVASLGNQEAAVV